ncbi:hypothetical protein [Kribbella hippodromi]
MSDEAGRTVELDAKGWPLLRSAQDIACYGKNPRNDSPCVLGEHRGKHRNAAGVEWLDDGDLAHPDWLNPEP